MYIPIHIEIAIRYNIFFIQFLVLAMLYTINHKFATTTSFTLVLFGKRECFYDVVISTTKVMNFEQITTNKHMRLVQTWLTFLPQS